MKLLFGLLISLAISSTFAVPVRSPKDDVDIVEVPRSTQRSSDSNGSDVDPDFRDFKGVVDTGVGYPFLAPSPHPFSFNLGFFDSFEDIFRRLRTRLWSVGSGESSEEGGFSLGPEPPKGANSTSVVKIVDGHKIEINDTVYGTGDSENGAIFKFRIINIRPLESGEDVTETKTGIDDESDTTTSGPAISKNRDIEGESNESNDSTHKAPNPGENEINANIDDPESTTEAITSSEMHDTLPYGISTSFESNNTIDRDTPDNRDELQLGEIDIVQPTTTTAESLSGEDASDGISASLSEDYTNPSSDTMKSERLSALVDAENVNDASQDDNNDGEFNESINQEPVPDAGQDEHEDLVESFDEQLSLGKRGNLAQGHLSRREDLSSDDDDEEDGEDVNHGLEAEWGGLDDRNILTNEIDTFEGVPIDLSNDIAVNDIMAADQGARINPDAEIFDVNEFTMNAAGGAVPERRFEALRDFK